VRPHARSYLIVLILVRHGESVANAQGLLLGRTDAELTENGRVQAENARALLVSPVAEVRSSPLLRARDTAALLALGPPVTVDERWIEVDYGEFEGERLGGIPAEVWQRWRRDRDFRPEGGETLAEVDRRTAAACEELFATDGAGARRSDGEGDVVVVSHVSPIKAAVAWALGTADLYWRLHLRTASVTRIGWNRNGPILHSFNEVGVAAGPLQASQSAGA
jgi:probable phosphoglycerate mutase